MRNAVVLLAALLLGVAGFLPTGAAEAQTPGRPEVVSIRFDGNDTFSDRELRAAIMTRQTECRSFLYAWVVPFCRIGADFSLDHGIFNPRIFGNDYWRIHAFYRSQGFRQVALDTTLARPTPTSVEIAFQVDEGDPVRISTLNMAGVSGIPGVADWLPVRVGDRLNIPMLEAAADTIVRRLNDLGYPRAEVFRDVFIPAGTLDGEVFFDVFAGPLARFGPIEVRGNNEVSELVVRRMLGIREGDRYSRERIYEAQRNLFSLEIFRHAAIDTVPGFDGDSIVPLTVHVTEGNTRRVRASAGWNNADCFSTEARWASRNFLGGARRLQLRARVSNAFATNFEDSICADAGTGEFARLNGIVAAEFRQPWIFFSPRNTLNSAVYVERRSVPDVYIREALGLDLSVTRVIGRSSPVTLSYQPQVGRLDAADVFFCTNFLVCNTDEIDVLASANVLAPVGLSFARDRTNRAVSPSGGYTMGVDIEIAGRSTFSSFDYQRAVADLTVFQGIGSAVLATRLRGGWLGASAFRGFDGTSREGIRIPPPQKRFYAGGPNSVRGYAQSQLGPRVVTVGVEELIFPRNGAGDAICDPEEVADLSCDASTLAEGDFESRPTGGSAVVEGSVELRFPLYRPYLAGAAFVDFGQVWADAEVASSNDVVVTPGIGFRYYTPIGPIRLDLAYRPAITRRFPVVTSAIRPWTEGTDPPGARIVDPTTGLPIDWVFVDALARLDAPVSFAEEPGFDPRRVQFQFSIGHAF